MLSPASSGVPGPGEMSTPSGSSSMKPSSDRASLRITIGSAPELAEILHEVVDERVVVVDDQYPGSPCEPQGRRIGVPAPTANLRCDGDEAHQARRRKRADHPEGDRRRRAEACRPERTSKAGPAHPRGTRRPTAIRLRAPSRMWVPVLMFSLLGVGALLIILNYVGALGSVNNAWLVVGLAFILGGIITATQYR